MKQIPLSLVNNLAPTVTTLCGAGYLTNYLGGAHYPILGILVIDEANPDKLGQQPMPYADEPRVRESTCELLLGAGQGLALSGNTRDR